MPLQVDLNASSAWTDLRERELVIGTWTRVSALRTVDTGELRVVIIVELPDGRPVYASQSLALLQDALARIAAAHEAAP